MRILHGAGQLLPAFAGVFAAASAEGQCIWSVHHAWHGFEGATAGTFHAGLQRVVCMGYRSGGPLITAAWDGAAWTELDTNGPSRRGGVAVAYDSARQRLVLYGGYLVGVTPNSYPTETWEWDGAAWSLVATTGPGGRGGAAMVYDELRHRAVLYGGQRAFPSSTYFTDTWEWDGSVWQRVADSDPYRVSGREFLVYDSGRARVLLYMSPAIAGVESFWDWDGAAWTARANPSGVSDVTWFMFDPSRQRAILSGRAAGTYGTWDLDTTSMVATRRSPTMVAGLAFDAARARAVCPYDLSTWEFDGAGTIIPGQFTQLTGGGSFDPGATLSFHAHAEGGSPGQYRWRHNNLALVDGGRVSGATTEDLTITQADPGDSGWYDAVFSNGCEPVASWRANVQVGPLSPWGSCYANCDNSSVAPILNVADFTCFLTRFAAEDPRANCDQNQSPPILSVADFTCFLQKFAAGCSAP